MTPITAAINSIDSAPRTREEIAFEHFIASYIIRYPNSFIDKANNNLVLHLIVESVFPISITVHIDTDYWYTSQHSSHGKIRDKIRALPTLSLPSLDHGIICKLLKNSGATDVIFNSIDSIFGEITATFPLFFLP